MDEEITRIFVKGFKSLQEESFIEIRPLTLLAGANSSGKSSIMQPLLMMKQTLEAAYDPGPLLLDGPNVRNTSADQILSRTKTGIKDEFMAGLDIHSTRYRDGQDVRSDLSFSLRLVKSRFGLQIGEVSYKRDDRHLVLRPEMTQEEMLEAEISWGSNRSKRYFNSDPKDWHIIFTPVRDRFFLKLRTNERDDDEVYAETTEHMDYSRAISGVIHLPALRGNPERNYRRSSIGPMFPGTFQNYAASIISHWHDTDDPRIHALEAALNHLGLTWKVSARHVDDVSVEIMVGRLTQEQKDADDLVSIADVGFGISQTLPVIVALLTAHPGQLVYIEQPEIHLHPRAQTAMALILAEAALRGVRVVAETHSSLLLSGVQSLVAEGSLPPEIVKLHWFRRKPEDGVTEITSADLDQAGAFGDWPEDFSSVEMDADYRYIHAAEARLGSS